MLRILSLVALCFLWMPTPEAQAQVAVFKVDQNTGVFLKEDKYNQWKQGAGQAAFKTPQEIKNWKGLGPFAGQISAAVNYGNGRVHIFLNDGRFLAYDIAKRKLVTEVPIEVNESTWPGLKPYATQLRAATRWNSNQIFFFLADGRYVLFDKTKRRVPPKYPRAITQKTWRGLSPYAQKIEAAVEWNSNLLYFFFNDGNYLRYDKNLDRVVTGYPRPTNDKNWPDMGDWFGRKVKPAPSLRAWKAKKPLPNGAKISIKVPRRMEGPIRTGPNSQEINQFVKAVPLVIASDSGPSANTVFEVTVLPTITGERIRGNSPGLYQKIVLKAAGGKYLAVSRARGGLILANQDLDNATIFVLDLTRGGLTGLFVYDDLIPYSRQNRVPMAANILATYFYAYGYHSAFSVMRRKELVAGSFFQVYLVK